MLLLPLPARRRHCRPSPSQTSRRLTTTFRPRRRAVRRHRRSPARACTVGTSRRSALIREWLCSNPTARNRSSGACLAGRFRPVPNHLCLVVVYTIATSRIYSRHVCDIRSRYSTRLVYTYRTGLAKLARRFRLPLSLSKLCTCTISRAFRHLYIVRIHRPTAQNGLGRTSTHIHTPRPSSPARALQLPFTYSRLSVQFLRKPPSPMSIAACAQSIACVLRPSSPLIVHPFLAGTFVFRSFHPPLPNSSLPLASFCVRPPRTLGHSSLAPSI